MYTMCNEHSTNGRCSKYFNIKEHSHAVRFLFLGTLLIFAFIMCTQTNITFSQEMCEFEEKMHY